MSVSSRHPKMRRDVLIFLALGAACSSPPSPPGTDVARGNAAPAPAPTPMATMPHGDHRPHHGGLVLMDGDLHFEVVFDSGGHHRVYLSDAVRNELPASAVSQVTITVLRPGDAPPEPLTLHVDDYGESWVADGRPVDRTDSRAVVSLTYQGAPYEIELPLASVPPDPAAPDPNATRPQ
jgi:hypothetical protein